VSLEAFFNWDKGFFVPLLHVSGEALVSLLACSVNSLLSRRGASGLTRVMGSPTTGVVGGGDNGEENPPGTWCADVVRLGDKFPSPVLEVDRREDMPRRIDF
jgi:hypothetical protein